MVQDYLHKAKVFSNEKLRRVQHSLVQAEDLFGDRVCVYATGSYGRSEAGPNSDLDLFMVSDTKEIMKDDKQKLVRRLSGIDEIKLQNHLINCVDENEIPGFDGDGKYLRCHTSQGFIQYLGGPEDDAQNTLTGRLLLLLESKPLLGLAEYDRLISLVIDRYFVDQPTNPTNFVPAFLFNDILRMWRTFCVNYEHNRKSGSSETKIKNLKLKYSRMLTCYSGLLYLLDVHAKHNSVSKQDVKDMISKTPTERLLAVKETCHNLDDATKEVVVSSLERALTDYSEFLEFMHREKDAIIIEAQKYHEQWREKSYKFGEAMEQALSGIGRVDGLSSILYRLILI